MNQAASVNYYACSTYANKGKIGCALGLHIRKADVESKVLKALSAKAIIEGDISPGENIEGYVQVADGTRRTIYRAQRPRNPDGSAATL